MPVRGTPNYVWFTEQPLGSGATGNVFGGRHKRTGEVCAIKVFMEQVRPSIVQAKKRELELMRKLNHGNIVRLLAIEQETHTKEHVLVMELCSEGSVYDMINKPDYYFGFPESEFLVFLQNFASGLEYLRLNGIVHRDIKPGNILCSVGEDGRSVYKLTDFGSAREQSNAEENFMSIHGTEEYLHPDVYGTALMGAKHDNRGFDAATDLWSIGATLYHIATGQLPFQAYGGRNNKESMFRIISEKKLGDISGVQKEQDGEIIWSKDLPKTCQLSASLKTRLVSLIAGTMEKDPRHQWKFEMFFEHCRKIGIALRVHFFLGLALQPCPLYLDRSLRVENAQTELANITGIPAKEQLWFYDRTDLLATLGGSSGLGKLPVTSEDNPVVVWAKPEKVQGLKPDSILILDIPAFSIESTNLPGDVTWSREVCGQVIHYKKCLQKQLKAQLFLFQIKDTLCEISKATFEKYSVMFSEAVQTFRALQLSGEMLFGKVPEGGATATAIPVSNDQIMIEKLGRLERHIRFQFPEFQRDNLVILGQQVSNCELKRCHSKIESFVEHAKATHDQFKKDKHRSLSYNEEQIHKYDKIKLNEVLKKSKKLVTDHCLYNTLDQYRKLVEWYCKLLKVCSDQLAHMEKDLKKFRSVCSEVFASIEKNYPMNEQMEREMPSTSSLMATAAAAAGSGDASSRSSQATGETEPSELCPTSTKLPSELFRVYLDLIKISHEDNLFIQQRIENEINENDDVLQRISRFFTP